MGNNFVFIYPWRTPNYCRFDFGISENQIWSDIQHTFPYADKRISSADLKERGFVSTND